MVYWERCIDIRRRIRRAQRMFWHASKYLFLVALAVVAVLGIRQFYDYQRHRHAQAFLREAIKDQKLQHTSEAIRNAQGCVDLAPDEIDAYVMLAHLLRSSGQKTSADECMEKMVALNPQSGRAHLRRGRYLLETNRKEDAEADVLQAQNLLPTDRDVLLLVIDYYSHRSQWEQARDVARKLRELHPDDAAACSRAAELEAHFGNRQGAIDALSAGVKADPQNEDFLYSLVNLLCDEQQLDSARNVLAAAGPSQPDAAIVKLLHARIALAQGLWREAAAEFERLRPALNAKPEITRQLNAWLGDCYGQMGNPARQLECWRQGVVADPQWLPLRRQIIDMLVSAGRLDEAIAAARQAQTACHTTPEDALQLAHLLMLQIKRAPTPAVAAEIEKLLDDTSRSFPDLFEVSLLRAQWLAAQDQTKEAEKVLLAAQEKFPRRLASWLALAGVAYQQDDPAAARSWLDRAEKSLGDSLPLRLARTAYLLWELGPAAAPALRKLIDDTEKFTPAEQVHLASALLLAGSRAGDYDFAARLCTRLSVARHADPSFWMLQLEVALRSGRVAGLEELLKEIEQREGKGPHWHYGQAVHFALLAKDGQDKLLIAAGEHLAQARDLAPGWSCVPLLAAQIDVSQGHPSAAAHYLWAVELGEARPVAVRQILEYLDAQQWYLDVYQVLQQLGQRPGALLLSPNGRDFQVALPLDDFAQACRAAEAAAAHSEKAADHLWLARVSEILGRQALADGHADRARRRLEEAEVHVVKATVLAPGDPAVWTAAFQFYLRLQHPDKARQVLAVAELKLPAARRACMAAQAWQGLGNRVEAEKCWLQVLRTGPGDDLRDRAASFLLRTGGEERLRAELEAALGTQPPLDAAGQNWVRRRLAWELAAQDNDEDRQRALRLVAQNVVGSSVAVQDRQLSAILLASTSNPAWRRSAIQLLEATSADQWHSAPEEKFFLAQLCVAERDLSRALRHLQELSTYFPSEPRYLAMLVRVLAQAGSVGPAETQLQHLETLAPEQLVTVAARAEVDLARGKYAEIPRHMQAFLQRPDSQPADPAVRLDQAATVLESLAGRARARKQDEAAAALAAAAESLRGQLVSRYPEAGLRLVVRLAQQDRFAEALARLADVAPRAESQPLADAIIRLLVTAKTSAQRSAIETILLAALDKQGRPASLLVAAALSYTWHEQYDQAESLLREALTKEKQHVAAMNNLALQLALQKRKPEEALELIQRAIRIAGPRPALLDTRSVVYFTAGNNAGALADLDQAISTAPQAVWYCHKARVLRAMHHEAAAREAEVKAQELGLRPELLHPLDRAEKR
jgi:tetratricopeptide (TPR) repeat protein